MELNSPGEITAGPDLWGREDSTVGSCSALTTRNAFLGLKTVTLYEKKKMTCNRVKVKLRSSTGISFADSNNILGKCRGQC